MPPAFQPRLRPPAPTRGPQRDFRGKHPPSADARAIAAQATCRMASSATSALAAAQ